MRIDERIVIPKGKQIQNATIKSVCTWTRRQAMRAVWTLRCRILKETGEDIFHLYEMTDCIEVGLHGDLETIVQPKKKLGRKKVRHRINNPRRV